MRRFTVTALTAELDALVRKRYPTVLVEGEVAQIQVPGSGHAYLTLRDKVGKGRGAQIGGVCWRDTWSNLRYRPKQGDKVVCRGRLAVYADRGIIQLYINDIEPAGKGRMAEEIAQRIARLRVDGLLDGARKRPLPEFPAWVGVATSPTGAALQDFLEVSRHRHPAARILHAPCFVQGDTAAASVLRAVALLIEDGRSEVIVITRGGGSKEDLLPFHDEQLARFVADSPIPILSAVGHQIDTTILDMVADAVAPTPSAAAVAALPDGLALRQRVDEATLALHRAVTRQVSARRQRLDALSARLRHPRDRIADIRRRATALRERLDRAGRRQVSDGRRELDAAHRRLEALSPLAVLGRGYAIVSGERGVVRHPEEVAPGDALEVRVHGGTFGVTRPR